MGTLTDILRLAQARAEKMGLPYEGALTPQEAHAVLQLAPGSRIVDVRTRAELEAGFRAEIARIAKDGVSEEELARARAQRGLEPVAASRAHVPGGRVCGWRCRCR